MVILLTALIRQIYVKCSAEEKKKYVENKSIQNSAETKLNFGIHLKFSNQFEIGSFMCCGGC